MNNRAHLDGGILSVPGGDDFVSGEINALGTGNYETSETKTKRHPDAERMAGNW